MLDAGGRDLKIYAFSVATRVHMTSFDVIAKAYQLCHPGNEYFLPYVEPLLYTKDYKKVRMKMIEYNMVLRFHVQEKYNGIGS